TVLPGVLSEGLPSRMASGTSLPVSWSVVSSESPIPLGVFASPQAGFDYFGSDAHHRSLAARIVAAISSGRGLVLVTGVPPPTLLNLCQALSKATSRHTVIGVTCGPELNGLELQRVSGEAASGHTPLFVLDAGDRLSDEQIAELCRSMFTGGNSAGVLLAWPAFADRFERPMLQAARRELAAHYHLLQLGKDEVDQFLRHQMGASEGMTAFSADTVAYIAEFANGDPVLVNRLARRVLEFRAYARRVLGFGPIRHIVPAPLREVLSPKAQQEDTPPATAFESLGALRPSHAPVFLQAIGTITETLTISDGQDADKSAPTALHPLPELAGLHADDADGSDRAAQRISGAKAESKRRDLASLPGPVWALAGAAAAVAIIAAIVVWLVISDRQAAQEAANGAPSKTTRTLTDLDSRNAGAAPRPNLVTLPVPEEVREPVPPQSVAAGNGARAPVKPVALPPGFIDEAAVTRSGDVPQAGAAETRPAASIPAVRPARQGGTDRPSSVQASTATAPSAPEPAAPARQIQRADAKQPQPPVSADADRVESRSIAQGETAAPDADPETISALLSRGDEFLRAKDIASARLYYERAADAGAATAALSMGETFDPVILSRMGLRNPWADPDAAAMWYHRAEQLSAPAAGRPQSDLPAQ
ncbi:MAG TPA: hypothetical protein VEU47_09130, partial [Candidatus Cybelea sp.]|nr:hypothetical protein [Candidatus Cybelea sp.]